MPGRYLADDQLECLTIVNTIIHIANYQELGLRMASFISTGGSICSLPSGASTQITALQASMLLFFCLAGVLLQAALPHTRNSVLLCRHHLVQALLASRPFSRMLGLDWDSLAAP